MKLRIGIVEDNPALMRNLLTGLSHFEQVEVCMKAINGRDILKQLQQCDKKGWPDALLMDIEMPQMNGIEATENIRRLGMDLKIVMLTVFDNEEKLFDAILAGANGYILKDEECSKIVAALEEASEGGAPMSATIALKALKLIRRQKPSLVENSDISNYDLSEREIEILEGLSNGLKYHQIAEKCFISPNTVRKHIDNIYKKLQVHSKIEAVQVIKKRNWF